MQTDYGTSLLSALLALAITAELSYLLVRFLPRSPWLARFAGRARLMEIEDMLRIDAKSTLLIVRIEGRRLLLASHSSTGPTLISELSETEPRASPQEAR